MHSCLPPQTQAAQHSRAGLCCCFHLVAGRWTCFWLEIGCGPGYAVWRAVGFYSGNYLRLRLVLKHCFCNIQAKYIGAGIFWGAVSCSVVGYHAHQAVFLLLLGAEAVCKGTKKRPLLQAAFLQAIQSSFPWQEAPCQQPTALPRTQRAAA